MDDRHIAESGGRIVAEASAAHRPGRCQSASGPLHGAASVAAVQLVDGGHQAVALVLLNPLAGGHQVMLQVMVALKVLHQDACLGQVAVGLKNT